MLLGSATTTSTSGRVVCASAAFATKQTAANAMRLRQRKHIKRASLGRVLRQVLHRIDKPERRRRIARVQIARDHNARPAADAGEDRNVLLPVRPAVRHRLPDDSRAALELPKLF